jgi:hypothetical protein
MCSAAVAAAASHFAQVLQNLANGVEFGEKESYMIPMNSFLRDNQKKCHELFKHLLVLSSRDKDNERQRGGR